MPALALVTCRQLPHLIAGDRLLQDELRRRGVTTVTAIWDDAGVEWDAFDAIVIRSPWDYHLSGGRFAEWLEQLAAVGRPVINPLATVCWNLHKRYLLDLEARGCRIPRTQLLARGERHSLQPGVCVKPAISGGAWRTLRIDGAPSAADEAALAAMLADGDVLVQEYVPEIAAGEWSLMFFDGQFSHAVLKRPAAGDFRVQAEWGGSVDVGEAPDAVLAAARRVMDVLPRLPYARIDLVESARGPLLMEAELIEPELFLDREPAAVPRLADAILR
jgi:glutathione synthase/RimK-type ligase-like ATP-grasp enzyme